MAKQKTNHRTKLEIAFDQNPSPDIFKLHALACFELFDYLSFDDIYSIGESCKRLNRIAGTYFRDNYPCNRCFFREEISSFKYYPINGFIQYVREFYINLCVESELDGFRNVSTKCNSLKNFTFSGWPAINEAKFDCIKEILPKIEKIRITIDRKSKDVYETILKYCSNVKMMFMDDCCFPFEEHVDIAWLHQKYTMLEHVSLTYSNRMEDCKVLLEQNPNIRSISCDANFMIANEDWLLTTNVKLDYLGINYIYTDNSNRLCSLLNQLRERKFYKKLRVTISHPNVVNEIGKMSAVERLCTSFGLDLGSENFPLMADMKEIRFCSYMHLNIEDFVSQLPNIERVSLPRKLTSNQVLVLIKRSKKLKELLAFFETQPLNLWALNKEREEFVGATKVTIYLEEKNFLATKWAYNDRDFRCIDIKRMVSWPHDF